MDRILYFSNVYSSFVKSDERIFKEWFAVTTFIFRPAKKYLIVFAFLNQLIFTIRRIRSCKFIVCHFSGYHSLIPAFLAKICGKPSFIILNGTECHNFPEYDYGYLRKPPLFWCSKKSLQLATLLLPVSESLVASDYTYAPTKFKFQGFRHFYKKLKTNHKVIHNGVNPNLFPLDATQPRLITSFVTIASDFGSFSRRSIKGLDLIIDLARLTPDNTYTLVGATAIADVELPSNVLMIGEIPNDQLYAIYNRSAFYLQLSASEGFGIALCEAMLCGCVPIVSNVGILPFIASGRGYVLQHKNVDDLVELVSYAVKEYDPGNITYYRDHILENFTLAKRAESLLAAISNATKA